MLFFLNAFLLGSFLSRVPDVMAELDTGKAGLGLALFAAPLGAMLASPFVGRLIDALTPGRVAFITGVLLSAAIGLVGTSSSVPMLAATLLVAGLVNGAMEVSMNAAVDRVEKETGARIIARCHGFWSLGFMAGALVAGALAQAGVGVMVHLLAVAVAGAAGTLAILPVYPRAPFAPVHREPGAGGGPVFAFPSRLTAGICLMGAGITLAEGAIYDWGALYLRVEIGSEPMTASMAFACFTLAMAAGRFGGDAIRGRFSAPAIVRGSALLAGAGLVAFVLSPNVVAGGLALSVMGLGVSLVFPIAVAAVSVKGGSAASNIAALSLTVMAALLTGPPVIGLLGEAFGLAVALVLLVPAIGLTFLFAGEARPAAPALVATVEPRSVDDRASAA